MESPKSIMKHAAALILSKLNVSRLLKELHRLYMNTAAVYNLPEGHIISQFEDRNLPSCSLDTFSLNFFF